MDSQALLVQKKGRECTDVLIKCILCEDKAGLIMVTADFSSRGLPMWDNVLDPNRTTQISKLSKDIGLNQICKLIYYFVVGTNNYFNVSRPMSAEQMKELTSEMAIKLWGWRFEEIPVFFEGVKNARWGKIYERLDPAIIWEHITAYEAERNLHLEQRALRGKTTEIKLESDGDKAGRGALNSIGAIIELGDTIRPKDK